MTIAVLMPVYDEGAALGATLESLRAHAEEATGVRVLIVDDGSRVPVDPVELPEPTPHFGYVLARHPMNLGQGAALETARQLALREPACTAYVTMDADGQHSARDVFVLARAVESGADVAFGDRFSGASNVPALRARLLVAARIFERTFTGLSLSDSHNGLRAFNRRALAAIPIRQNRMAHATEIKQRVRDAVSLTVVEVPVTVRYTPETLKKGQRGLGAADILRDLLSHYLFGESK
jgi:polyprenyl-phospho-N-acetylgalactosaminyl synthase